MATFSDNLRQIKEAQQPQRTYTRNEIIKSKATQILKDFQQVCTDRASRGEGYASVEFQVFSWKFLHVAQKIEAGADTRMVVDILKKELSILGFKKYNINYAPYDAGPYYIITIVAFW